MRILFVQCSNSGTAYWRLYNPWVGIHRNGLAEARVLWWQKDLKEAHPWQVYINPYQDALMAARVDGEFTAYVATADVIIFQAVHTREALEYIYSIKYAMEQDQINSCPIVMEVDDDLINTPASNPAHEAYKPGSYNLDIAISQLKHSDAIITSTPYLKSLYSEFNDNIYVVNNAIDLRVWDRTQNKPKPKIRIGWVGGASHDADLEMLIPVIKSVTNNYKDARFVFLHGASREIRDLPGVTYVKKWARIDKYPQHIASQDFDIALAPLQDGSFNRGKSNLRWLEYSALRIPTVASNVGHFKETIKHSEDGFLASSANEFEYYISLLIEDAKLRRTMGAAAYNRVKKDFNIDKVSATYVDYLKEIIARGVVKKSPPLVIGIESESPEAAPMSPITEVKDDAAIQPEYHNVTQVEQFNPQSTEVIQ